MADVINTQTLEMRASVNEGAEPYNSSPWQVITRAQYDLWSIIPQQYRKWVLDHVEEMTAPEKAVVDLAILNQMRDGIAAQLDQQEDILRAFMLVVLDEFNSRAATTNAILTAIDNAASLAALKATVATINDIPTRTASQLRSAIRNKLGA